MSYDAKFYQMLAEAHTAILQRSRDLELLKKDIATQEMIDGVDQTWVEELRTRASEDYLSLQYAHELYADLAQHLVKMRLMSMFLDHSLESETFNMVFEEMMGEDE